MFPFLYSSLGTYMKYKYHTYLWSCMPYTFRAEISEKQQKSAGLQLMHFTAARLITRMCVTRFGEKKIVPTNWTSSRSLNGSKKKFCHERSIRREILFNSPPQQSVIMIIEFPQKPRTRLRYALVL